jgi:hypothetical protein
MIREMVEAFVDAKMERADISVALYRVSAGVGGPRLIKRISQRSREAIEAMLQTAPAAKSPPDRFAIDIMLAAMAGAMRSLLEAGPTSATVRKSREQLVLLCQSYMAAATAKRVKNTQCGRSRFLGTTALRAIDSVSPSVIPAT